MIDEINGRTPEEIRKGLECCKPVWVDNHWKTCDVKCPYIENVGEFCRTQLVADALAYIQQLERERDAAVDDIELGVCCETCKHDNDDDEGAFCNKKVWQRFLITIAGPAMNIVLGFLLMLVVVRDKISLQSFSKWSAPLYVRKLPNLRNLLC